MEQTEQDLDHSHEDELKPGPGADEHEPKWENNSCESGSQTSFEYATPNYEGRLEDLKELILTRDQDVKLEYVSNENWQALANHLILKDTPKPSIRHLQIVANEDDVPYVTLLFELLEPGLETLILFIDHAQGEPTARERYVIDSKEILKHSATLKTFAIHDRFGDPVGYGAKIVLETGNFDCIRPILEVCDLKEVSFEISVYPLQQFEKATNQIYTRGFDKLRLDTVETLYLVPYDWPGIVWGMGCDGDVSGWVEKPIADFLRGVFGNRPVRPVLRYICLGMQARTQRYRDRWIGERFSYKVKWRRSRTEGKQTKWFPKVKEVPFSVEDGFRVWSVLFYDGG